MKAMRSTLLASSVLASTLILGVGSALAQEAAATENRTETVIVTGSRIAQPNLVTTSPITQVTAADIQSQGVTRVEDLVNQLPQAFAAQNATVSNGATGTAQVDLRGLGAARTLVLIDGKRMPYGSPNSVPADLNQIPGALVQRVEVLTGGASAVYGSDAIAGVVNFIMQKDFEGIKVDAQYSFYQHNNDYDGVGNFREVIARRQAGNPSEFRLPDDNVIDGYGKEATIVMGVSTDDDRGNITVYGSYRNNGEVLQANRDYSACAIGVATAAGGTEFTCGGSGTNALGRFISLANDADLTLSSGQNFRNFTGNDVYNFGPLNYYQRPDERYSFGAFGRYELNENAELYTQLMFTETRSVAQIAPSGAFLGGGNGPSGGFLIGCDNPLLSAAQRTGIGCTPAQITAGDPVEVLIGRRNVEGGGRQDDLGYTSYRGVFGLRGTIVEGWDYDVSAQYSKVNLDRVYRNEFSVTRVGRALDVVQGANGPVCRSTIPTASGFIADAACVPYNLWAVGGVTQDQLDYLQTPGIQVGSTRQQVVTASVSGDLGTIGVKSPFAESTVKVAFGAEYRSDGLVSEPDTAFSSGDLFGQGGPTIGLAGETESIDTFVEFQAPLVEDRPFAKLISLDAAYRYSDYSTGISTNTYKVGADWAPTDSVRFRGSYSKAARAPNVIELFEAQGLGLFDLDADPCGPNPTATLAQCTATGVPAANYGSVLLDSPAGQYNQFNGGNPNLNPEEATTYTLGVVFTPTFLPGFNMTVDYFNIDLTDRVDTVDPLVTISQCYEQNDASACARINRNAIGNFWTAGGFIEAFNTNIGGLKTSGVDVNANYRFAFEDFSLPVPGGLTLNFTGTFLEQLETDPGVGASAIFDCVGFYANQCGTPNPEWRHRARATWNTPWDADLSLTWRHYGEVTLYDFSNTVRVDRNFDAENYFDVSGSWVAREWVTFRAGVNNVLDDNPQLSASVGTTGNGNTYPQTYDALGRYFFAGVTFNF